MNLYKPTYYISVLISLLAFAIVALIWLNLEFELFWGFFKFDLTFARFGSEYLGTILYIAYTIILLIVSSVLLPLISKSIKNQSNLLFKIGMILLSLFFAGLLLYSYIVYDILTTDYTEFQIVDWIVRILLYIVVFYSCSLLSSTLFCVVLPKKKMWPIIVLIILCYLFFIIWDLFDNQVFEMLFKDSGFFDKVEIWFLYLIDNWVPFLIDTGIGMVYSLLSISAVIILYFTAKNKKK